jgi:hypothetical protein
MKPWFYLFVAFMIAVAMATSGCHSADEPTGAPLGLALLSSDTVHMESSAGAHFRFRIMSNNTPVADAYLSVVDSRSGFSYRVGPTMADGIVTLNDTITPADPGGLFRYHCSAVKDGYRASDPVDVYLEMMLNLRVQVAVTSLNSTSLGVRWSPLDMRPDTIVATRDGVAVARTIVTGDTSAVIDGLEAGVIYSVSVHTADGPSMSVLWSPANKISVRLYESADKTSGHAAGINLATGATIDIHDTNAAHDADLVFVSNVSSSSGVSLASPGAWWVSGYRNGRHTRLSPLTFNSVTLDQTFYTRDLTQFFDSSTTQGMDVRDVLGYYYGMPAVAYCKTESGNYARIEILPQGGGSLLGGTYGKRYMDMVIWYQPVANVPYAGRGRRR